MPYSSSVVGDVYLAVLLYSDLLSGRVRGPVAAGCNRQVHHGDFIFSWLIDVNIVECTGSITQLRSVLFDMGSFKNLGNFGSLVQFKLK